METLQFAHPNERKLKAKRALAAGKSLRQAAQEAGVPHTTVHHWRKTGVFDKLEDSDPNAYVDVPRSSDDAMIGALTNQYPATSPYESGNAPTGMPQSLAQVIDATAGVRAPLADPQYPNGGYGVVTQEGTQDWYPRNQRSIKAFSRYVNGLLGGGRPDAALHAAKVIDPDFGMTEFQHTRLLQSLSTLMMAESLRQIEPPPVVIQTLAAYALTDTQALAEQLADVYRSTYAQVELMVPETNILAKARYRAQAMADSCNSGLATALGLQWLQHKADTGTELDTAECRDFARSWRAQYGESHGDRLATLEMDEAQEDAANGLALRRSHAN